MDPANPAISADETAEVVEQVEQKPVPTDELAQEPVDAVLIEEVPCLTQDDLSAIVDLSNGDPLLLISLLGALILSGVLFKNLRTHSRLKEELAFKNAEIRALKDSE